MHQEQRARTHDLLQERNLNRALFAHPGHVTWLTGLPGLWRPGADMYAGGPSLVWYEARQFTLIAVDSQAALAESFGQEPNCQVIGYQGYAYTQPPAGAEHLARMLQEVVAASGAAGPTGIEMRHLPLSLANTLHGAQASGVEMVPIDGWLEPLRMIKTAEELAVMRRNFDLIAVAQAAAREAVQPGKLELDVWFAIHQALQRAARETLPLGNDCVVGRRMGGPPQPVEILPTDSFIVDLSTILEGYWSDSCVTYYATAPSARQAHMHATVAEALQLAISLARPGTIAGELDRSVRRLITTAGYPDYPHHTGHGIGVAGHEAPRIVPYSQQPLQAGMVIMLEPGIYYPGETEVRLEHAVLITEQGAELLTAYDVRIEA
jgi:Xaa-Pro aminopeptidase